MDITQYQLNTPERNHAPPIPPKLPTIDMLKEANGLLPLGPAVGAKDAEFIDHTLLGNEYMRDSNNFIMDLIEQQVSYQKPTDAAVADEDAFSAKTTEALHSELQFQNAIFQFVNKHGEIQCGGPEDGESILTNDHVTDATDYNNKVQSQYLSLNDSFLAATPAESVPIVQTTHHHEFHPLPTSLANICDLNQPHKPNVSELSLLADEALNVSSLIPASELICAGSNARKVLPHKKRISKKLKGAESSPEYSLAATEKKEKSQEHRTHTSMRFSCELCGHTAASQLAFFAHLKLHYEPAAATEAPANKIKTSLNDVNLPKMFIQQNTCQSQEKKNVEEENVGTDVFPDVHINFEDFHQVDESVVHAMNASNDNENENDDMKILSANSIDKCIQFVTQHDVVPPKLVNSEEIEFSDSEDMLEGIRNVVDKVSIEDTCDAVDMVTSNACRTPWFAKSNFNGISFRSKVISSTEFANNDFDIPKATFEANKAEKKNNLKEQQQSKNKPKKDGLTDLSASTAKEKNLEHFQERSSDEVVVPKRVTLVAAKYLMASSGETSRCSANAQEDDTQTVKKIVMDEDDFDYADECTSQFKMGKKSFFCTECGRDFNSFNALRYHNITHTGLRPYQCDKCGRSFFVQGALTSHLRTHTDVRPYDCKQCDRKFRQHGDLKHHIASIHNEEKSYQCEYCGKAFARKYSLVLHRRIHTSERGYKCDLCPKSFRASIYLKNHERTHSGEKPYKCQSCDKKFRVSGDLRRHMRSCALKRMIEKV